MLPYKPFCGNLFLYDFMFKTLSEWLLSQYAENCNSHLVVAVASWTIVKDSLEIFRMLLKDSEKVGESGERLAESF